MALYCKGKQNFLWVLVKIKSSAWYYLRTCHSCILILFQQSLQIATHMWFKLVKYAHVMLLLRKLRLQITCNQAHYRMQTVVSLVDIKHPVIHPASAPLFFALLGPTRSIGTEHWQRTYINRFWAPLTDIPLVYLLQPIHQTAREPNCLKKMTFYCDFSISQPLASARYCILDNKSFHKRCKLNCGHVSTSKHALHLLI